MADTGPRPRRTRQDWAIPAGLGVPSTNTASGVFGGRLAYYPTPYWALIASVDEALGVATFISPTVPAGAPALTTTALLQTTYGIARDWSVGARGGYTRAQYFGIPLLQNGWLVGGSFNYEIWRNLMLTLDYQYTTMHANVPFDSFVNQHGHGWCYLEILNGAILMEAEKRTGMNWPRGLQG